MQYLLVSRERYPRLARNVLLAARSADPSLRIVYQDQRCILVEVVPAKA
jgi:hypothetical protein